MRYKLLLVVIFLMVWFFTGCSSPVIEENAQVTLTSLLEKGFILGEDRSPGRRFFVIESEFVHFDLDGTRTGVETFTLELEYLPASFTDSDRNEYRCQRFSIQQGNESPLSIPALEGWTYSFIMGIDEESQVFGIDHARFENLKMENGRPLDPETSYLVYNTFIDFHAFCDIFARRTLEGRGIQDLHKIGDKIVHEAAFSEPPVNLGGNIAEGSAFKNGEVTLELRGVSLVDGAPCAVVGFDSGESSFRMIIRPTPAMEITTVGGSHYKGDLYIDLESNWTRKVTMGEIVVTETNLPMPPHKLNSVIERSTTIRVEEQITSR